jgi:hypothetical protein
MYAKEQKKIDVNEKMTQLHLIHKICLNTSSHPTYVVEYAVNQIIGKQDRFCHLFINSRT